MALVFLPQYGGDQAESYQLGTDTAIRRFIVGRDNGSGAIDESGALFSPIEFYAQGGYDQAKAQSQVVGSAQFDRVRVTQYSPYAVLAEVYQSNDSFYDLPAPVDPQQAAGGVYNFSTQERRFEIPFLVEVSKAVPGSTTPAVRKEPTVYTDTTPITTIDVEVEVETWRFAFEVALVNAQVNAIHRINGLAYRFKGARSVRQVGTGEDPAYKVRYSWEFDIGSRSSEMTTTDGVSQSLPVEFNGINFAGVSFPGTWWRPPYCQIAIATREIQFDSIVGPVTLKQPSEAYFVEGRLGNELGWQSLPGNPIQP